MGTAEEMWAFILSPSNWLIVLAVALLLFGRRIFTFLFRPGWERHVSWGKHRLDIPFLILAALLFGFVLGRATAPLRLSSLGSSTIRSLPDTLEAISWQVTEVIDGDTIEIRHGQLKERVRLLRINTPERTERGYHEARAALQRLLNRAQVELVFERFGHHERDSHGRLIAYVFVGDRNINVEMVRLGWSRFWTRYGRGRFADEFEAAERQARAARRGLWAEEAATENGQGNGR